MATKRKEDEIVDSGFKSGVDGKLVALVAVFMILGIWMLQRSSAASVTLEAEGALLGAGASVQADSNASDGSFVKFADTLPDNEEQRFPGDPNPLVTGKSFWGASIGGNAPVVGRHETSGSKSMSLHRTFWQWSHHDNPPNDGIFNAVKDDHANNRLPWVSTKTPSWASVAAGDHDARIDQLLRELDSYGKPVWLTFHHEPEGGAGSNKVDDPGGAVAWRGMQRKVRERMNALGTENIAFAPILMSYTWEPASGRNPADWWIDKSEGVWDFYAVDHYRDNESGNMFSSNWWKRFDADIKNKNIPYAFGEWGNRGGDAQAASEMKDFWEYGFNNGRDIVGYAYFDSGLNSPNGSWALVNEQLDYFQDVQNNDQRVMRINDLGSGGTSNNYGTISGSIAVPSADSYRIWVRMSAQNSNNNQIRLSLNNEQYIFLAGGNNVPASGWTWVDFDTNASNKMIADLPQGEVSVLVTGVEAGVKVDRILISDDDCVPSGNGDNCVLTQPDPDPTPDPDPADTTPPTGVITAPAESAQLHGVVPVTTQVDDNIGVIKVNFLIDDVFQESVTSSPFVWDFDTTAFSDGDHTIKIKIYDAENNKTEVSRNISVINTVPEPDPIDTTPPTGSILAPKNEEIVSGLYKIRTQVNDNVGVVKVNFLIDNVFQKADTSAPFEWNFDTTAFSEGEHEVKIKIYDAENNKTEYQQVNTVQNVVPEPPDTTSPSVPSITSAVLRPDETIEVNWSASTDNIELAGYELIKEENGNFVETVNLGVNTTRYLDGAVSEGNTYTYSVLAVDEAGNKSQVSAKSVVDYPLPPDTTGPSMPANLTANASEGAVLLSWGASTDDSGVKNYVVYKNGQAVASPTGTSYSDNNLEYDTVYNYRVQAVDTNNNFSELSNQVSVIINEPEPVPEPNPVDDVFPEAAIFSPGNGSTVSGSVPIITDVSDNVGVKKINFLINGVRQKTITADPFNWTWNTNNFADGQYEVLIKVYDDANNKTEVRINVTVQNNQPVPIPEPEPEPEPLPIIIPDPDSTPPTAPRNLEARAASGNQVNLAWSENPISEDVTGYYVYRNGEQVAEVTNGQTVGDGSLEIGTGYFYQIAAYDAAGNVSEFSDPIEIVTREDEKVVSVLLTGDVIGDDTNEGISRARIVYSDSSSKHIIKANSLGRYFVLDAPVGDYTILYRKNSLGYERQKVQVNFGDNAEETVNVRLVKK